MKWDTVVLSIRVDQDVEEARKMMDFLQNSGLFEADLSLVVSDPCEGVGSAGSALNALLTTAEHLCASRGLSVLNEQLLESSKILILQLGQSNTSLPLGAAFLVPPDCPLTETPWIAIDCPIVNAIRNVSLLATSTERGIWICGTDSLWKINDFNRYLFASDEIAAFCFEGKSCDCQSHGVYDLDNENMVQSINYRCETPATAPKLVLGLIYLPPPLATRFLSLYSVYPISRSTYYGIDSGALGLKLSLFFDLILATCLSKIDFVSTHVFDKSDKNIDVLMHSRKEIWKRFHNVKCRAYCLSLTYYEYLGPMTSKPAMELGNAVKSLRDKMLGRVNGMILEEKQHYSKAVLKTLIASNECCDEKINIFDYLAEMCLTSIPRCAHALMTTAEYLALSAHGKGGLRSGPAANPSFTKIFECIKNDPRDREHVQKLYHLIEEKWMSTETNMIRAARHLEGAAQIYTQMEMQRICQKYIPMPVNKALLSTPKSITVQAAARIDLFGGWLDTPPITLHAKPSAVVNMAVTVDGKRPIRCRLRQSSAPGVSVKTEGNTLFFSNSAEVFASHNKPGNPGALICACLVSIGIPGLPTDDLNSILEKKFASEGIEIECISCLPHGSGLGTSSILAAAIIEGLWRFGGISFTKKNICHAVLMVEQLLTTGGGWQDQVGGLYSGVKKGYINNEDGSVDVEEIPISPEFEEEINRRMVLIYTGKTRLARNLLQEVIRGWYSGGPIREVIKSLEDNVDEFAEAIKKGEMRCDLIDVYYNAKKTLAAGCEPDIVANLISSLERENLIETAWLAGAGGGGFLYVWLKPNVTVNQIRSHLQKCGTTEMTVHTIAIDNFPMNSGI